jgi:hypothetical protein
VYGAAPEYVRYRQADACDGWHVLPVLKPIETGTLFAVAEDGSCEAIPQPKAVLSLGEEVPPASFVHGGTGVGLKF